MNYSRFYIFFCIRNLSQLKTIKTIYKLRHYSSSPKSLYKMCSLVNVVRPPKCVSGMIQFDKTKFDTQVTLTILSINNSKVSKILPYIKKYLFKMSRMKPVDNINEEQTKVLLNPCMILTWNDFDEAARERLEFHNITSSNLSTTSITITYDNFQAKDIFRAVLPSEFGFSSFSQIGHIVHLNLRENLLPHKDLIAQVLLDKVANTRTVVNKVDMINNSYRNFEMEVLCGSKDMFVSVKENYCIFEFDFSKVYWNPRLGTEHERIVFNLNEDEVLLDIFAGVGPFAIPAAKKKVITFANDLNPDCFKWLNHNIKMNKIDEKYIKTFNKDGRDFIETDLKGILLGYINKCKVHIVMNLPALAVEFLDSFVNLYNKNEVSTINIAPIVYVYCFAKGENVIEIAKDSVIKNIGFDISSKIIGIYRVRTVSNFKEMMCVSFKLDEDILVSQRLQSKRKCEGVNAEIEQCLLIPLSNAI